MPPRELWIVGVVAGVMLAARSLGATQTVTLNFDEEVGEDWVDGVTTTGGILSLAQAIAHAEGYYVPGSAPNRANNPGDLKIPGWIGAKTGTEGVSVFPSATEGWRRLYLQLDLIRTGKSRVYTPAMSLSDLAAKWTDTQQSAWLANVLDFLTVHGYAGVDETTVLADVLA